MPGSPSIPRTNHTNEAANVLNRLRRTIKTKRPSQNKFLTNIYIHTAIRSHPRFFTRENGEENMRNAKNRANTVIEIPGFETRVLQIMKNNINLSKSRQSAKITGTKRTRSSSRK